MKRGELIERGIAAGITLAFMAVVRPDPDPELWGVALISLLMYESIRICVGCIREKSRKKKESKYITVSLGDIRRWANTELYWPMKEVS
jgi:hypothetical protein